MTPTQPKRLMPWLGRHPLRTVLRVAVAVAGLGVTGWLLSTVWPEPDQVARQPVAADNPTNLAPLLWDRSRCWSWELTRIRPTIP